MTNLIPDDPNRVLMPDLTRAFALFGIAVVNVIGFAQPLTTGFHEGGLERPVDRIAYGAVASLFMMKSYPLFSMMFGAGLFYQQAAAARSGARFTARHFRRMAALVALGAVHFVFFWMGDILMAYGLLGALFYLQRGASVRTLARTGAALIALNTVLLFVFGGLLWLTEQTAAAQIAAAGYDRMTADALAVFGGGSFADAARYRLSLLPTLLVSLLGQQGLSVFGFFCLGLAAAKSGVLDKPDVPIWRLSRRVFLPAGLGGSLLGTWILLQARSSVDSTFLFGCAVVMAFSAFAALGYMGLIAAVSKQAGLFRRFAARAGSASLTAYLLQSLLFSLIFAAYGFGAYGRLTAGEAIGAAAGVAVLSLGVSGLWRSFAKRGPVEVLLRRVTYWDRA